MEYRSLGKSALKVPVLSFGTGTFSGLGPLFSTWGKSGAGEARRLVDLRLGAGANLFDTADVYSNGAGEEIPHIQRRIAEPTTVAEAERVIRHIVNTYYRPPIDLHGQRSADRGEYDVLGTFTEVCRAELRG